MFSDTGVLKDIDTGQPEKGGAIVDIFQCTYVPFLCLQNGEHLDQLKSALTPVWVPWTMPIRSINRANTPLQWRNNKAQFERQNVKTPQWAPARLESSLMVNRTFWVQPWNFSDQTTFVEKVDSINQNKAFCLVAVDLTPARLCHILSKEQNYTEAWKEVAPHDLRQKRRIRTHHRALAESKCVRYLVTICCLISPVLRTPGCHYTLRAKWEGQTSE